MFENIYALIMRVYICYFLVFFSLCESNKQRINRCFSNPNFFNYLKSNTSLVKDSSLYIRLISPALTMGVFLTLCHMVHWFKIGKLQWTVFVVCSFTLSLHLQTWIAKHKQCKELNAIINAFGLFAFLVHKKHHISLHQEKDNAIKSYLDS